MRIEQIPLPGKPYVDASGRLVGIFAGLRIDEYEPIIEPVLDADGEPVLDDAGQPVMCATGERLASSRVELPEIPAGAVEVDEIPPPTLDEIRAAMPSLSAWQVRKALSQASLRQQVEDAMAMATQDVQDAWNYATEFKRTHSLVVSMASQLGWTEEQVDDLFRLGITL